MRVYLLILFFIFLYPPLIHSDESDWGNSGGNISCNSDKNCTVRIKDGEEYQILTASYLEGLKKSVIEKEAELVKDSDLIGLRKKILNNPVVIEALILKAKKEIEESKQ